jgi:uncharacterized membrane protein SirB2
MYLTIKLIHMAAAGLSISLFCLRGGLVLGGRGTSWLAHWSLRVTPHVVDTVLLGTAIYLAVILRQAPIADAWLTAKVFALILYIILGSLALKRAPTQSTRAAAFLAALLTFAYIVGVAMTKSVWSWLPVS